MTAPARQAAAAAALYLAVTAIGVVATARVLDAGLARARHDTNSRVESAAWFVATLAAALASLGVSLQVRRDNAAECQRTLRAVPCQAQRNCLLVVSGFVWTCAGAAVLCLLALARVVYLRDALTAVATVAWPVNTVWYWASTVSYPPLPRARPVL